MKTAIACEPGAAVFVVTHFRPDTEPDAMYKFIGVFSDEDTCNRVIGELKLQEGFRDYKDGFEVQKFIVNVTHWDGGFFSGKEITE